MRRALGAGIVVVALATALSAGASAPRAGLVVAGNSFGGLALGATDAEVRAAWGGRFGRCRSCPHPTWYFNERAFEPRGVAVEFRRGRAAALFTLWSPEGWRTSRGLRIGDPAARIGRLHGPVLRQECGLYAALTRRDAAAVTAFYVLDGKVWGFGLFRAGVPVCR